MELLILPAATLVLILFAAIKMCFFDKVFKPSLWMLFLSLLYYPIYQILFHSGLVTTSSPFYNFLNLPEEYFFYASFLVLVFFIALIVGLRINIKVFRVVPGRHGYAQISFFLLVFSFFAFFMFVKGYGGFSYVMEYAANIRSGTDPNKSYLAAFFRMFTYYLEFVFLVFYCAYLIKSKLFSRYLLILLILFPIVLFKLVLDSGRAGFISFFVMCVFCYWYINGRPPILKLLAVLFLSVVIVIYGKTLIFPFFTGRESVASENVSFIISLNRFFEEFAHPYFSTVVTLYSNSSSERLFGDFFYWFLKPLKFIFDDIPDSVSYFNTYMVTGHWDSMIPPGGVAFSLQQGGYLFVPIFGFLLGVFYSCVDKVVSRSDAREAPLIVAFFAIVTLYFPGFVLSADIALVLQAFFVFFILFFFLFILGYFKIKF
ncbi:hypothetical protein C7R88_10165 [Plesiomonas shigelloides]|uniref:hypothetical protein n=1 Tax=Plesiomonas shigelloides TaxID=703 RepID=UPI000D12CAE6|nr:hypothetical protein [Plesiomonas shigelloides]AVQ87625.1 hypothetical protein C7R88_10165 [Plesiomonas shigelloides]